MKLKRIPFYRLAPNIITISGLCLGISALRYALDDKFTIATMLIITAAITDSLDGRVARLLKCESDFGAQLDSLADMISFGVAPAIITYLWSLNTIPYIGIGWSVVLFYITCGALRLARFNSDLSDPIQIERSKIFFKGIPIPAAACLLLLPMITTFDMMPNLQYSPWLIAIYSIIIGSLMISKIPTFSAKKIIIPEAYIIVVQLMLSLLIIALILEPWWTLPLVGMLYFLLIPYSIQLYRKLYKNH